MYYFPILYYFYGPESIRISFEMNWDAPIERWRERKNRIQNFRRFMYEIASFIAI